jgi:hypothetical protein
MKRFDGLIGNLTLNLPGGSAAPQPTSPPPASSVWCQYNNYYWQKEYMCVGVCVCVRVDSLIYSCLYMF